MVDTSEVLAKMLVYFLQVIRFIFAYDPDAHVGSINFRMQLQKILSGIKHASVLYTIFIAWRELGSRLLALIGNPPIRKEQDELINLTGLIPGKVACVSVI